MKNQMSKGSHRNQGRNRSASESQSGSGSLVICSRNNDNAGNRRPSGSKHK